ncbi:MAG TPA: IPT/TIG domain-containing protein [Fimbriimonadaceae bacterium]|nr:IPT/TIG domain-containing protein [Fimbriimonadaceae bacterium]
MNPYTKFFGLATLLLSIVVAGCSGKGRDSGDGDISPVLTSITPNTATIGSPAFTIQVDGNNFLSGAKVLWNNFERPTTEISPRRLTAEIPASDLQQQATVTVAVRNPNGKISNGIQFLVGNPNPAPTITGVNPTTANAGGGPFALTVTGTNFVQGAQVRWNGQVRQTLFVSPTQLTAQITGADIAQAGQNEITVLNPAPGGGTSNAVTFTVQ